MEFNKYVSDFKEKKYDKFEEFYNLTSRQVYFVVLGITQDEMLADDIVQETYTSFLKNIEKIDEKRNVLSYLIKIAKNKCIDNHRKGEKVVLDNEIVNSADEVHKKININEILSLLENDDEREIVIYHIIFDYKFKEISKIMEKPLGTILWKYNKAIKYLKERMDKLYEIL